MLKKITDRVYYMNYDNEKKHSLIGLIIGDKFSLIVDAGSSKEQSLEFLNIIEKMDIPSLKYLALTHSHDNHVLGAINFDLINIVNGMTSDKLKRNSKNESSLFSHIIYDEFLKVDLGGIVVELERIPSDHSRDCSIINIPTEKVVFLGDILYSNRKYVEPCFSKDLMIPLLKELQCYEADYYIASHNDVYSNESFMEYSKFLINIGKAVKENNDFNDIKNKIAPNESFNTDTLDMYIKAFILGNKE